METLKKNQNMDGGFNQGRQNAATAIITQIKSTQII